MSNKSPQERFDEIYLPTAEIQRYRRAIQVLFTHLNVCSSI